MEIQTPPPITGVKGCLAPARRHVACVKTGPALKARANRRARRVIRESLRTGEPIRRFRPATAWDLA